LESNQGVRRQAHEMLMRFANTTVLDEAVAIVSTVSDRDGLTFDELTRDLLSAIAANPLLTRSCANTRFVDLLQDALSHPGFEEVVLDLTAKIVGLTEEKGGGLQGSGVGEGLVALSISLQRSEGGTRDRAMDIYERLLDSALSDAEQAAEDSLIRFKL
jgi:hypothetical protein